jgi:hypothetical protein
MEREARGRVWQGSTRRKYVPARASVPRAFRQPLNTNAPAAVWAYLATALGSRLVGSKS